jgi:tetratricopeptide (TPR) repeat protein
MKVIFVLLSVLLSWNVYSQQNPDKLYALAEAAFDDGNYPKALLLLNDCIREDPGFLDAYFMRAQTREQLRDLEGALTDYSIVLDKVPNHPEALLNRGQLRYRLKKYIQAEEDFRTILKIPPGGITQRIYFNKAARVGGQNQIMTAQSFTLPIVYNYLGLIALHTDQYQDAIVWLDSAIRLQKSEADYFVNRALAYQGMYDTTAAMKDYEKALTLNPEHALALNNLSLFKFKESRPDLLAQAIQGDSLQLQPYLQRAKLRFEDGDYQGAQRDLSKALNLEDRDPEIWFTRGLVRERLSDFEGAYSDYTKAIDLKEDHFKSWINRANVLLKLQRYQDAIDDYSVALIYHADFASAYYNRAIAKRYLGLRVEACEDLTKAERLGMKVDEKMKATFCVKQE